VTRRALGRAGTNLAAWGWYALMMVPVASVPGGSFPSLVQRPGPGRVFWAAWWTSDPRRYDVEPDDYGFVEGPRATGDAVGAAYDSLRKGRGRAVYDVCVGELLARRAYRAGAPQRRAVGQDFEVVARGWLEEQGLDPLTVTSRQVRAAWRKLVTAVHPDRAAGSSVDMDAMRKQYQAALAVVQAREQATVRTEIAMGRAPARKVRKPRKRKGEQGAADLGIG
jgi:hypothetical protein